jgi:uncharacterized BrkB/YihY/UPF0761 family membrane protein
MTAHKSINVALVALTFVLAMATTAWCAKDAQDVQKAADAGFPIPGELKALLNLYKAGIAMSVLTAILLLMAIGAFHFNTKVFGIVKAVLCVVVLVIGFMVIGFSSQLTNLPSNKQYGSAGVATGVVSILAVGSCSMTVFKMLVK